MLSSYPKLNSETEQSSQLQPPCLLVMQPKEPGRVRAKVTRPEHSLELLVGIFCLHRHAFMNIQEYLKKAMEDGSKIQVNFDAPNLEIHAYEASPKRS